MSKFSDFVGTSLSKFQIAIGGVQLKNSAGNLQIRNAGDTADASITASKLTNTGTTIDIGTTNVLTLQQNASQASALTIIYPSAKATDGQVLAQKAGTAAGIVEFQFVSAGTTSQCVSTDTTSIAFGSTSPVTLFTLPANAVVEDVRVVVDTAFNGTPSISIGIAGTTSKYMASNQVDLKDVVSAKVYEVYPGIAASGSAESLIATYSAGSATVGAARIEVDFVIPT